MYEIKDILIEEFSVSNNEAEMLQTYFDSHLDLDTFKVVTAIRSYKFRVRTFGQYIAFLEGLTDVTNCGELKIRIKDLLIENLTFEQKKNLLLKWTFSDLYDIGTQEPNSKHLMRNTQENDRPWHTSYDLHNPLPQFECSPDITSHSCGCGQWLDDKQNQINNFLDELTGKFISMRSAEFHTSDHILIDEGSEIITKCCSVYIDRSGKLCSFTNTMREVELRSICSLITKKYLFNRFQSVLN